MVQLLEKCLVDIDESKVLILINKILVDAWLIYIESLVDIYESWLMNPILVDKQTSWTTWTVYDKNSLFLA
jgi:hypothetical protein